MLYSAETSSYLKPSVLGHSLFLSYYTQSEAQKMDALNLKLKKLHVQHLRAECNVLRSEARRIVIEVDEARIKVEQAQLHCQKAITLLSLTLSEYKDYLIASNVITKGDADKGLHDDRPEKVQDVNRQLVAMRTAVERALEAKRKIENAVKVKEMEFRTALRDAGMTEDELASGSAEEEQATGGLLSRKSMAGLSADTSASTSTTLASTSIDTAKPADKLSTGKTGMTFSFPRFRRPYPTLPRFLP
jgi:hypothetical protein